MSSASRLAVLSAVLPIAVGLAVIHPSASHGAVDVAPLATQSLSVSQTIRSQNVAEAVFAVAAPNVRAMLQASAPSLDPGLAAGVAGELEGTGRRYQLVTAALDYLGTPYVFGGADHYGIDCSGLTMQAYAAIGVPLAHSVSGQDAAGQTVSQSEARPGDLVVFDDDQHVGLYLGADSVVAAPDYGQSVEVQSLADWSGDPYHFVRLISD